MSAVPDYPNLSEGMGPADEKHPNVVLIDGDAEFKTTAERTSTGWCIAEWEVYERDGTPHWFCRSYYTVSLELIAALERAQAQLDAQPELFPMPARAKPRVLMHFVDVGHMDGAGDAAHFVCPRCKHDAGWTPATATEIRRGIPCPNCNTEHSHDD